MFRRFYLRTRSASSPAARPTYPLWFVPALVVVGTLLGTVAYRLTCSPGGMQAQRELSQQTAMPKTVTATPSKIAASSVRPVSLEGLRVQILNGCGVKGLAKIITPSLRSRGFDVRETKNASHFDYKQSQIIDRTGDLERARAVADSLGIDSKNVSSEISTNLVDIDLTLIVGADYRSLNLRLKGSTQE